MNQAATAESTPDAIDAAVGVRCVLEAGYRHFDRLQYRDAKECFTRAVAMDSTSSEARQALNLVIQSIVPRWHFGMLNDRLRNDVYQAAIERTVQPGQVVLDVGSGSGLLAMMAARAGARKVYSCEMNETIAGRARRIVEANGYADRVEIIAAKSDEVAVGREMECPADVLVTETLDSGLLGEGVLPIVLDARARLLVEGAPVIPRSARVYAALLEARAVWELNHVDRASGFDVSSFNDFSTTGAYPIRLARFPHRFLSEPVEICAVDFMGELAPANRAEFEVAASESGACHAIAFWFDLRLDDETMFDNSPRNEHSHWKQAVQCFPAPLDVASATRWRLAVERHLTGFEFDLARA